MIFAINYRNFLDNMYLFKILSIDDSNSSSNSKFQSRTNVLILAVLSAASSFFVAFAILLFSLTYNDLKNGSTDESRKVFYPLPQENFNTVFPERQELILRKSDLEVPCMFYFI